MFISHIYIVDKSSSGDNIGMFYSYVCKIRILQCAGNINDKQNVSEDLQWLRRYIAVTLFSRDLPEKAISIEL